MDEHGLLVTHSTRLLRFDGNLFGGLLSFICSFSPEGVGEGGYGKQKSYMTCMSIQGGSGWGATDRRARMALISPIRSPPPPPPPGREALLRLASVLGGGAGAAVGPGPLSSGCGSNRRMWGL